MKSVLVTGASGFIGRQALPFLLSAGYDVHAVTIEEPVESAREIHWHKVDLLSSGAVEALLAEIKPTHLLHFAWYAVPGKFWTARENLQWTKASLDLLEAFARNGGRRIVMAGTCAEYDWQDGYCSEQRTPISPQSLYGSCKGALGMVLESFSRQSGISAAWGRIFFLYGPHEHPARLVPSIIRALLKGEPALCSHGKQVRDFLHVADVASAFVALLGSEVMGAVNIASGRAITIRELATMIAEKLGRGDLLRFGAVPAPPDDPPLLVARVDRLHEEVGWHPTYDLNTGLDHAIAWWRQS